MVEFILLSGMMLILPLFEKLEILKPTRTTLSTLNIPIGIISFFAGIHVMRAFGATFAFPGIMGMIAGILLCFDIFKSLPKDEKRIAQLHNIMATFQVPVGIITIIAAIIGVFLKPRL